MHWPVLLIAVLMGSSLILGAMATASAAWRKPERWFTALGSFFMVMGLAGFFGCMFSNFGGLDWAGSFEWPVGFVRDVVQLPTGEKFVANDAAGRVQLYDSAGRFIRGWRPDVVNENFDLRAVDASRVELRTTKTHRRFVYASDGHLLETGTYPRDEQWHAQGEWQWFPTRPWLVPFSSPPMAFATFFAGGLIMLYVQRRQTA
jgi:hypothetical protein